MQKLITILFTALLSVTLLASQAEAGKRFGGGISFGKSYSMPKKTFSSRDTYSNTATQQKATTGTQTTTPRRSGMAGILGGLLAGSLLGALFFGGGFHGIQLTDILVIGLLAFLAFKLFGSSRRQRPAYADAPDGQAYPSYSEPMQRETVQPDAVFSPAQGFGTALGVGEQKTPDWFNKEAFLEGAQRHFILLQKAWDEQNWSEISSYVAPELMTELKRERAKNGEQHTEVVSVMAELANFIDNGDHVVASLNFYGWLKEDSTETTEFNEVWHLTRDMSVPNADWVIVGIEQP